MRHAILLVILTSICGATPVFTCTVSDSSGNIVSNSCAWREGTFGYHSNVGAGGSPQAWSVVVDAGFYVANDGRSPYRTSVSLSDYASFSLPVVITGGAGSAYLWYSGWSYVGYHDATFGVKFGTAGYLAASASAPCYNDTRKDSQNYFNCYIPFTYDVPFTLSGYGAVSGHLSGGIEWDNWYFRATATLKGIVNELGSQQLTAQDATIQVMPEPTMFPAMILITALGVCGYRRSLTRRHQ